MPFYEFTCVECKAKDMFILSIDKRNEVQKCEKCASEMTREVSTPLLMGFDSYGRSGK